MGFMDFEAAKRIYADGPMRAVIYTLKKYDAYHCLISPDTRSANKVEKAFRHLPEDFRTWLDVCGGGLLFDTVLLTCRAHDGALDLDFDTFFDVNSPSALAELGIPRGYTVFALLSTGDAVCFGKGGVHLWETELQAFTYRWRSFTEWLGEEVKTGERLIKDGALDPVKIKVGQGDE